MTRSFCLSLIAVLFACGILTLGDVANAGQQDVAQPNVIIVMTDDQGYGELSCHGNPVLSTPNLDSLATQSVRFTDFHVAPMCTPTRGQLMTGIDAFRNGAMNVSSGRTLLRRDLKTMADHFSAAGYRTGMFGKWHLGDNYPYRPHDRGFETAVWFPSSHVSAVPDYWNNDYFDDTYWRNNEPEEFEGYCTDVFFDQAMDWMKSCAAEGKPFFTYLPTNAPHGPHFVPEKYRDPIRRALIEAQDKGEVAAIEPARVRALVSFLAMIANIDENMGRLEEFLDEQNLRDNTIVIFLTDNGSTMGPRYFNAGMRGGKVTLWEGGHRAPCFVRWPEGGLREPGEVSELTQVQDLLPTLLDLCGLPAAESNLDGINLGGLLRGETDSLDDRKLVINYSRMPIRITPDDNPATPRMDGAAVLWKRWRLLENRELYDLTTDPAQQRNVIEDHPDVAAAMQAHLQEWWSEVEPLVNEPQPIIIGNELENPARLTACEWYDVFVDQQRQIRNGAQKNGTWHVIVDQPGTYDFELRRWPREASLPLTAGCPAEQVTDGRYPRGVPLDIKSAAIAIQQRNETQAVAADAQSVTFQLDLHQGPTELVTTFFDSSGVQLCGAYYVYVRRVEEE